MALFLKKGTKPQSSKRRWEYLGENLSGLLFEAEAFA